MRRGGGGIAGGCDEPEVQATRCALRKSNREVRKSLVALSLLRYIAYVRWMVETLDMVDGEIEALPPALQARLLRLMEAVENVGLENLRGPHVRHIEGKLWELRAKASEGIARGLYVTMTGRRVVILHVFVKKSQKTPVNALEIARGRMKQVKP